MDKQKLLGLWTMMRTVMLSCRRKAANNKSFAPRHMSCRSRPKQVRGRLDELMSASHDANIVHVLHRMVLLVCVYPITYPGMSCLAHNFNPCSQPK